MIDEATFVREAEAMLPGLYRLCMIILRAVECRDVGRSRERTSCPGLKKERYHDMMYLF